MHSKAGPSQSLSTTSPSKSDPRRRSFLGWPWPKGEGWDNIVGIYASHHHRSLDTDPRRPAPDTHHLGALSDAGSERALLDVVLVRSCCGALDRNRLVEL